MVSVRRICKTELLPTDTSMLKITVQADCDNAPKKLLLRDLNIAFARADVEGILDKFSDDMCWQIIGQAELRGKAAAREALEAMKNAAATELLIHSIITDGRDGAVNASLSRQQRTKTTKRIQLAFPTSLAPKTLASSCFSIECMSSKISIFCTN